MYDSQGREPSTGIYGCINHMIGWLQKSHQPSGRTLTNKLIHHMLDSFDGDDNLIRSICSYIQDLNAHVPVYQTGIDQSSYHTFTNNHAKLYTKHPPRMYSRLDFEKFSSYALKEAKFDNINLKHLTWYLKELRTCFITMCPDEKLNHQDDRTSVFDIHGDTNDHLLLRATIDAAEYCVLNKCSISYKTPSEYLHDLRKHLTAPVSLQDKLPRLLYSHFIWLLDRITDDKVDDCIIKKFQVPLNKDVEDFFESNAQIIASWFHSNRLEIARLGLILDNPSECLYHAQLKLQHDLYSRIDKIYSPTLDVELIYNCDKPLLSMYNKTVIDNIELLVLGAKNLRDTSLLKGIRKIMKQGVILPKFESLGIIITNLEGFYGSTIRSVEKQKNISMKEATIIEYLNACIEYECFGTHSRPFIHMIESPSVKIIYDTYLNSIQPGIAEELDTQNVHRWLSTWSSLSEFRSIGLSTNNQIELIMPTCLNIISQKAVEERKPLIEQADWILSQNLIAESIANSCTGSGNLKLYHILLQLLKSDTPRIPPSYLRVHSKDLKWHQSMHRHLKQLGILDKLRIVDDCVDIIQYKAAKFYRRCNDNSKVIEISNNLINQSTKAEYKVLGALLSIKSSKKPFLCSKDSYLRIIDAISNLAGETKVEFRLKLLRYMLKSNVAGFNQWNSELTNIQEVLEKESYVEETILDVTKWMPVLDNVRLDAKVKTLKQFCSCINQQINETETVIDQEKLISAINTLFNLHLRMVQTSCQLDGSQYKQWTIESLINIMSLITKYQSRISEENINLMSGKEFLDSTLYDWLSVINSLIAIIMKHDGDTVMKHDCLWREGLIKIVEEIASEYPESLLYLTISNLASPTEEMVDFDEKPTFTDINMQNGKRESPVSISNKLNSLSLFQGEIDTNDRLVDEQIGESNVADKGDHFWIRVYRKISESKRFAQPWKEILSETRNFQIEMRKIAYFRGDILRKLCDKLPRVLYEFFTEFVGYHLMDSDMLIERKRQIAQCERLLNHYVKYARTKIKYLLISNDDESMSKYDIWFGEKFGPNLREMDYRLNLLISKCPLENIQANQMLKLIRSITSLAGLCRTHLNDYNDKNKNILYTELISKKLSSNQFNASVPLPGVICQPLKKTSLSKVTSNAIITIHKISQTINILNSKTMPKKLQILGSDGKTRSFLLKSQEDLRLDSYMMSLFGCVNKFLLRDKRLQNLESSLIGTYSITPLGPMCGLIEWIECPSLCSFVRDWQQSPKGVKKMQKLYADTCEIVCNPKIQTSEKANDDKPIARHKNCQYSPNTNSNIDLFYQRLWVETITNKKKKNITKDFLGQIKPSLASCKKLRKTLDAGVLESVIESLINNGHPRELIADQLRRSSITAHSHWVKQKNYINSCAIMSVMGYLVGLGDRHLDNILLDLECGRVVHVDYGVCFELGQRLPIPELVPFRLTPNMINAMGFGGLEGRFSEICTDFMQLLREKSDLMLHLLDPVHFQFMIKHDSADQDSTNSSVSIFNPSSLIYSRKLASINSESVAQLLESEFSKSNTNQTSSSLRANNSNLENILDQTNSSFEMHSQESVSKIRYEDNLLTPDETIDAAVCLIDEEPTNKYRNQADAMSNINNLTRLRHIQIVEPLQPTVSSSQPAQITTTSRSETNGPMSIFSYELRPLEKIATSNLKLTKKDFEIIFKRIQDKLSGTDENLREYIETTKISSKSYRSSSITSNDSISYGDEIDPDDCENDEDDLIRLHLVQSVGEQVSGLIKQSTLLKNYAKMFEGWMPWI